MEQNESESDGQPIEELTFEEAMSSLESVVGRIEADDLTLQETLALFERGTLLARRCAVLLDQADLRVLELSEVLRGDAEPPAGSP